MSILSWSWRSFPPSGPSAICSSLNTGAFFRPLSFSVKFLRDFSSLLSWKMVQSASSSVFLGSVVDAAFHFLLVWYYCTLTIREGILRMNGSKCVSLSTLESFSVLILTINWTLPLRFVTEFSPGGSRTTTSRRFWPVSWSLGTFNQRNKFLISIGLTFFFPFKIINEFFLIFHKNFFLKIFSQNFFFQKFSQKIFFKIFFRIQICFRTGLWMNFFFILKKHDWKWIVFWMFRPDTVIYHTFRNQFFYFSLYLGT